MSPGPIQLDQATALTLMLGPNGSVGIQASTDELGEILAKRLRISPKTSHDETTFVVENELGARARTESPGSVVRHRVREPRDARIDRALGLEDVHHAFFERERRHIAVEPRVCKRAIDEVERDAPWSVVLVDGLQTGDAPQEGRSRQTAENENRHFAFEALELERPAGAVVKRNVRHRLARCRGLDQSEPHHPSHRPILRPVYSKMCVSSGQEPI